MFKSTFQTVESLIKNESVKSIASKPVIESSVTTVSAAKEKVATEKKNVIQLKRTVAIAPAEEKEPEKDVISLQITTGTAPAAGSTASNSTTVPKKSIHLRLGAMTKTWKSKKPWRSEKV